MLLICSDDSGHLASLGVQDWPPTSEFKGAFPELYDDFSAAVPVPDYVRRDGVYNIGSHFPINALGPDLGRHFVQVIFNDRSSVFSP